MWMQAHANERSCAFRIFVCRHTVQFILLLSQHTQLTALTLKTENDAPNWKHKLTFLNAIPLFTILHGFTFPYEFFCIQIKTERLEEKKRAKKRRTTVHVYIETDLEFKKTEPLGNCFSIVNEGVKVHWPFECDVLNSLLDIKTFWYSCRISKAKYTTENSNENSGANSFEHMEVLGEPFKSQPFHLSQTKCLYNKFAIKIL